MQLLWPVSQATAVASPWGNFFETALDGSGFGSAGTVEHLNTTSTGAPTWTIEVGASYYIANSLAFQCH